MTADQRAPALPAPPDVMRGRPRQPPGLTHRTRGARFGLLVEGGVLVTFAAVGLWTLAFHAWQTLAHGATWTGAYGLYLTDDYQYLAWFRDASHHVLVSNLFVLHPTPHDYFEPVAALSGVAVALGVAPWVALVAWEGIALGAVVTAVSAFVHRSLAGPWRRAAAVALALFGGWVGLHVDLWLPFWGWGYPMGLLGLACTLGSLLSYSRAREAGRLPWLAALMAALAALLHPWQGEVTVAAVLGGEAIMWLQGHRSRMAGIVLEVLAAGLPIVYYAALPLFDVSWKLASLSSVTGAPPSLLAPLLPLALGAVLAYRLRPRTFLAAATRIWPPVALALLEAAVRGIGTAPTHALLGVTVPLGVLAVEGVTSLRRPRRRSRVAATEATTLAPGVPPPIRWLGAALAAAVVAVLTIPVTASHMSSAATVVRREPWPRTGDEQALAYLARVRAPGGVLASGAISAVVPSATGRHVYAGDCTWSQPGCYERNANSWRVVDWGRWNPRFARPFVWRLNARFVLQACASHASVADIRAELGDLVGSVRGFGCAHVYTLRRPAT